MSELLEKLKGLDSSALEELRNKIIQLAQQYYIPGVTSINEQSLENPFLRTSVSNVGASTGVLNFKDGEQETKIFTSELNLSHYPFSELRLKALADSLEIIIESFLYARDVNHHIHPHVNKDRAPEEGVADLTEELTGVRIDASFDFNHHSGHQMTIYENHTIAEGRKKIPSRIVSERDCIQTTFNPFNYNHRKEVTLDGNTYIESHTFINTSDQPILLSYASHPYYWLPGGEEGFKNTKITVIINGEEYLLQDLAQYQDEDKAPNNNYFENLPVFDGKGIVRLRRPDGINVDITHEGNGFELGVPGIQLFARGPSKERFVRDLYRKLYIDLIRIYQNIRILNTVGINTEGLLPAELCNGLGNAKDYLLALANDIADRESSICIEDQSSGGNGLRTLSSIQEQEDGKRKVLYLQPGQTATFTKRIKVYKAA